MGDVVATFKADGGGFTLYKERILMHGREVQPLEGVTARVEAGSALQQRVTAGRLLAMGVFAFAAQKQSGGEVYLSIESPAFFWMIEVDRKKRDQAMKFAAQVNNAARRAIAHATHVAPTPRPAPAPSLPRPGWYPDNRDPRYQRWWDGQRWTDSVRMGYGGPSS